MYYCIYQITNKINGNRYIGQHKYEDEANPMGNYKGSGRALHKAYAKYGIENFEIEILYKRIRDKSTINAMEIWAIEKYKPEYNIAKGGQGGWPEVPQLVRNKISDALKGRQLSEETKRKISMSHRGKPHPHKGDIGRTISEETRKKVSESMKTYWARRKK
jgi:group I intron endonuclease